MKIKFGDLTARQMKEICDKHSECDARCPLFPLCDEQPWLWYLDKEIDVPDEEEGKCRTKRSSL